MAARDRRARLALALFAGLTLAAAGLAKDVARRHERGGALRAELGRRKPTALSEATLARFASLEERVLAVYYVSPPERMPAEMRRMQVEVGDLMEALRRRFPERFDFQIVDPASRPGLEGFSARRRISPFRVRSVTRDSWDERTVWSTLALSYGARPEALIRGLGPAELPELQALLVAWLDEMTQPRAPRIALAAPEGFEELASELEARGGVTRVDLDAGAEVPEVDLLLWMRPRSVSGEQLRGLERLLARGAGAILAGSRWEARDELLADGRGATRFEPVEGALDEIGAHFGLRTSTALVLDETSEELELPGGKERASHWIRCIAPDQDFHRFAGQPNGTLLFRAPSPFVPEPARLRERGWTAEVLATTTDQAWAEVPPAAAVSFAELAPERGEPVAKQALIVGLVHDEPRRGELFFLAADTPFADGMLSREHVAHRRLLDVLLDETTSSKRLVLAGLPSAVPEALPLAAPLERLLWRAFCVGLPVVGLALLLALRTFSPGRSATGGLAGWSLLRRARRLVVPAFSLALALAAVRAAAATDLALDVSAEQASELAPLTRSIARTAGAAGEIQAELFLSRPATLPPRLRGPVGELEERLVDLDRAGARLDLRRRVPEDLAPAELEALEAGGIRAFEAATQDEEVTRVARFHASLRLTRDERSLVLAFPDERAFERLEFRLALALLRLGGRPAPHVAFASDVPRLSAAEAFEQYQQKSLFAPRGTDVYALARESLERDGFRVTHVNPRAPELPADADVLVWLQPRRSVEAMLEETVRFLHGGGRVVLAAQHFTLLSQQFRGGDFEPKYWPRPQLPDLDLLYFPELSIQLVREVLLDELALSIETESQLTGRKGGRDFERQASALPFQIRASAANFAPDSPVTRRLGDQAFLYANRLTWDETKLAALGLAATPLITTSERTWSFAWKGGWVPPELLRGPAELEGSSGAGFLGRQPLAVLFEGTFPRPSAPLRLEASAPAPAPGPPADSTTDVASTEAIAGAAEGASADPRPWPQPAPGKLLFLGDSEFLKNERLLDPDFRGDQLLWNAVASLAFEPELAELATRQRSVQGFGYVEPEQRLLWRAAVITSGPALLVLFAAGLALVRARPRAWGRPV